MRNATVAERVLMMTNPTGMMARSLSLSGEREKATLEKRRAGVKSETLSLLRVWLQHGESAPAGREQESAHLLSGIVDDSLLCENPSYETARKQGSIRHPDSALSFASRDNRGQRKVMPTYQRKKTSKILRAKGNRDQLPSLQQMPAARERTHSQRQQ